MKTSQDTKELLRCLLIGINAAESSEESGIAMSLRQVLEKFRITIAGYMINNSDVEVFDDVFAKSGWDNQGFRWCRCEKESVRGRIVMELAIVEFDGNRQTWNRI